MWSPWLPFLCAAWFVGSPLHQTEVIDSPAPLTVQAQQALRREATAPRGDRREAILLLLELYRELRVDNDLPPAAKRRWLNRLQVRLSRVADELDRRGAEQLAPQGADPDSAEVGNSASQADALVTIVQQVVAPDRWEANGGHGVIHFWRRANLLAVGGPGLGGVLAQQGLNQNGVAARGPVDRGEELVTLIQNTISPPHWDVHGGPGRIVYWRPGHALVVTASQQVHRQAAGAVQQLRRAGR